MRLNGGRLLRLVLMLVACWAIPDLAGAEHDFRDSIVKIYTTRAVPNYWTPWSAPTPQGGGGSGCVIGGERILTNAHVVSDQTFVQVRLHGRSKRYRAKVLSVSHEADLALLTVEDKAFFEGVEPLEFGKLPQTQDEVFVLGFPLGGDTLSVTKGVISRIEHRQYAHGSSFLLAAQIDAAINPGNSGGPVQQDGRIVGIVMQSLRAKDAENIGYMVPITIIEHVMQDLQDGTLNGFPVLGIVFQAMENPDLREHHGLGTEQTGVVITEVIPGSPAKGHLAVGDVVLAVDGHPVANNASVEFRPKERTSLSYYVQRHQIGEPIEVEVLHQGEIRKVSFNLTLGRQDSLLVPMEIYDQRPSYYIFSGLVFAPLTKNLLKSWGRNWRDKAPHHLVAKLEYNVPKREGQEVLNLKNLVEVLEQKSDDKYLSVELKYGTKLLLNQQNAEQAHQEILNTYRIARDRSGDLK